MGSIALKLGYLASGRMDFSITKYPKHIWDIMAGTHICFLSGINLYQNGKKIERLEKLTYLPELLWCSEDRFLHFKSEKKIKFQI